MRLAKRRTLRTNVMVERSTGESMYPKHIDSPVVNIWTNADVLPEFVQPSVTPVGTQEHIPDEGHRTLVPLASAFICKTALRSPGRDS